MYSIFFSLWDCWCSWLFYHRVGENKTQASASSLFRYWLRNLHDIIFVPSNVFNRTKRNFSWSPDCTNIIQQHLYEIVLIELEPSFTLTPACCSVQPMMLMLLNGPFKGKTKSQYLSTNCASYECPCSLSARIYTWRYTVPPHSVLNLVVSSSIHLAGCCIKRASMSVSKVCLRNTETETLQTLFCSHKLYTFVPLSLCCIS